MLFFLYLFMLQQLMVSPSVTGVVGSEGEGCFSVLRSGDILISFSLSASCEVLRPSLGLCLCV